MASSETTPPSSCPTNPVSSASPSLRATKRKLDDAFQTLDDAVGSSDSVERPSPTKKAHTARSLYATLAKYGIKSMNSKLSTSGNNFETLSKTTPHLTAILTRAATRTRKALPFTFPGHRSLSVTPLSPTTEYRPSSIPLFLSRLATFKLATYGNKPPAIDAVAASKCGWINDGKDRLVCGICSVSWVVSGRDGLNRDAANTLIEKQRVSLVEMHKNGCPWKTRQCDSSIYRLPLQSPAATANEIKTSASTLDPVLQGIEIKHPLTSTQLKSLRSVIYSFSSATSAVSEGSDFLHVPSPAQMPLIKDPSETAILTALFGWALAPPSPERPCPSSLFRASSLIPVAPPTPSISRASSVSFPRTPTPGPSTPRPDLRNSSDKVTKRDTSLLHCILCQRRVGLWAFAPQPHVSLPQNGVDAPALANGYQTQLRAHSQRQFDLLKEHRSYCPYVVRSTIVPSLLVPSPSGPTSNGHTRSNSSVAQLNGQNGAFEGWRAVLTVVLRYGMDQRQRMGLTRTSTQKEGEANGNGEHGELADLDSVEAMVAGVKRRGGKELLGYVKGLLG